MNGARRDKMKNNAEISIITATYNLLLAGRQDQIISCLESVRMQKNCSFEHLVIAGGSTDGTLELLRPYEEKGWIKIYSKADKGLYDAFNHGIAKAQGKYINFLNSDDCFICDDAISLSIEALKKTHSDISFADCYEIYGQEKVFKEGSLAEILFRMPFCHQTVFCRKELLEELHGFNLKYHIAADRDILFRAFQQGAKFCKVNKALVNFSLGGVSTINMKATAADDCLVLYDNLQKLIPITQDQCKKYVQLGVLPYNVIYKLVRKQPLQVQLPCYILIIKHQLFWFKERLKRIRYWFVKIRTRKGKRIFRALGIDIINEEKK